MCGLFGSISTYLTKEEVEIFQDLGVVSVLRGRYGGGVVVVPNSEKKDIKTIKTQWNVTDALYSTEFFNLAKQPRMLMGHARFPTTGGVKDADLHPHEVGDIVGMHNGTLTEVAGVRVGKDENDSRLLFTMLNNRGLEETFKSVKGSYACTWIDKKAKTLNLFRNFDRGLCLGCLEGAESTVFWASEEEMLEFVLSRHLPFVNTNVKVYPVPTSTLITFNIYQKGGGFTKPVMKYINLTPPTRLDHTPNGTKYKTIDGYSCDFYTLQGYLQEGCWVCHKKHTMLDFHTKGKLSWRTSTTYECADCTVAPPGLPDNDMPMMM